MNARKLIVMDLDGTLLNEEGIVTQKTKKYLGKLKKEGYVIAIATGRILKSALIATDGAEFANYIVADAGAAVYKMQADNWEEVDADLISRKIAEEINRRVKKELGITVSIGISWNKIFAKLGSDYKKPDGITEFNRTNYRELIWKLPVSDLLYVGRSTNRTLQKYGIRTIGELARTDPSFLERQLGKMGLVIYSFANGWDDSPVSVEGYQAPIKSIGNSTTTPRDLENDQDVQIILMALAESVAARLRKHGFKCNVVSISIRDNGLFHFSRQRKLQDPTDITDEIMSAAYQLFRENYHWPRPIRSLGIRADDLVMGQVPVQLDLFMNEQRREKQEKLDRAVDDIRRRFGYHSVQRAFMYQDKILSSLDAQGSHTVHPVGYFNGR